MRKIVKIQAHIHLIIATREDPQLPLARLRARGQLQEIRAVDLRFMPDEASEPLCNAVTDRKNSQSMLEQLERDNLFLVSMDDHRQWYGYHHLFRDVLRSTVLQQQPDVMGTLHRRASEWYERNEFPLESIHHARASGDHERAANHLEAIWREMDTNYQSATWFNQVQALPDSVVRRYPVLCAGCGWSRLHQGDLEGAELWFHAAERWLNTQFREEMQVVDTAEFDMLPATLHSARAYRAMASGDTSETLPNSASKLLALAMGFEAVPGKF